MTCRFIRLLTLGLAAVLSACSARAAVSSGAPDLPKYRFQIGQELTFGGSSTFRYQNNGSMVDLVVQRIWIIGANPDGSWRVVFQTSVRQQGSGGSGGTSNFGQCNLYPDGRAKREAFSNLPIDPQRVLPPLPSNQAELATGWTRTDSASGDTVRCHPLPATPGSNLFQFRMDVIDPIDAIYGMTSTATVTLDCDRGIPTKFEETNTQTYGFNGKGSGEIDLQQSQAHDAAWAGQFAADADLYFAAASTYSSAGESDRSDPARLKRSLEAARSRLKAVRARFQVPVFQSAINEMLAEYPETSRYDLEEAERQSELLRKPPIPWSTTDLQGKSQSLKEYQGNVVVMDFWYRGCGWCMKAMPQVKALAAQFRGQRVVVLGMNTDSNPADARFVVRAFALNYPVLRAKDVASRYGIQGFPTLLVLDQRGVVRDIHLGYSPTLQTDLTQSVARLLRHPNGPRT